MTANSLWFTARGAGLSAMLVLSLAAALGAAGSVRTRSVPTRVVIQYLHRTAAGLGLGLIVVHAGPVLADERISAAPVSRRTQGSQPETPEQPDRGGLPGTVGTEKAEHLAPLDH